MILSLIRDQPTDKSTGGQLSVDDIPECYTLELPDGRCIPAGRYEVVVMHSPHLSQLAGHPVDTPRLLNVPGHEGILIHSGNIPADTEGCILVGRERQTDEVLHSHDAFTALFFKIRAARARGELVFIEVTQGDANGPASSDPVVP